MLGTPPAFVLSQDQTLKLIYIHSHREFLNLVCPNSKEILGYHFTLFSFQGSSFKWKILRFFSFSVGVSTVDLYYVTTTSTRCQYCFCWFFMVICVRAVLSVFCVMSDAGITSYHVCFSVSTGSFSLLSVLCHVCDRKLSLSCLSS